MLTLTFEKVFPKGKAFTLIKIPLMMVMVIIIIIRVAVIIVVIIMVMVKVAVIMAMTVVMAPGKGSGKNPKKSFPRRKEKFPSGLLIQNGTHVGIIGILIDISPV